ncbi:MAG: hypothetical protein ACREF6_09275 [Alphaproteobacteria bacterium]
MALEIHLKGRSQAAFVGFRGRERASVFIKRGRDMEYIRRGMSFRRVKPDKSIETAKVLSVVMDGQQIPHVRYEINVVRPSRAAVFKDGPRILSLSTFTDTYRERGGR